jgi:hypothetical protein
MHADGALEPAIPHVIGTARAIMPSANRSMNAGAVAEAIRDGRPGARLHVEKR